MRGEETRIQTTQEFHFSVWWGHLTVVKCSCFLIRSSPLLKLIRQKLVFRERQKKEFIQCSEEVSNKDGEGLRAQI